jgi:hypothetical protein
MQAFMTDSSDIGYCVTVRPTTRKELKEEACWTETKGWVVSLEDERTDLEETLQAEEEEDVEEIARMHKATPDAWPVPMRIFRFIHFYAGFRRKEDLEWWLIELAIPEEFILEVYSVDLAIDPLLDMSKVENVKRLNDGCREGYFAAGGGGPPCSSWTRSRHKNDGGPRPLRWRHELWGRTDVVLTANEQQKVLLGNSLLEAMISCFYSLLAVGGMGFLEHPDDPGVAPYPSIWVTDLLMGFAKEAKANFFILDQCQYGQACQKKTRIMMFGLRQSGEAMAKKLMQKKCTHQKHALVLSGKNELGQWKTSAAQVYPSGLCQALAKTIITNFMEMMSSGQGPMVMHKARDVHPAPAPGRANRMRNHGEKVRAPPLSSRWTEVKRWKVLYGGRWRQTEHTNINETRAVVGLMRHLGRSRANWNHRVLVLCDSLVAIGALSKGRSSCGPLLRLCRQAAACSLCFGFTLLLRYVPSELNVADGPSRLMGIGAAEETVRAHADRAQPRQKSVPQAVPEMTEGNVAKLLAQGRQADGFAGG